MSALIQAIVSGVRKPEDKQDGRKVNKTFEVPSTLVEEADDEAEPLPQAAIPDVVGISQWQILYDKILASNREPQPPHVEVTKLLKTVFREHALANHPEFAKYFKSELRGRQMEDRVLEKAKAAAAALSASQAAASHAAASHARGSAALPAPRLRDKWALALARYRCLRPRVQVYLTLSHPEYSALAFWLGLFIMAIIVLNTVTFCMESVPHWENTELLARLDIVDYVCLGIFTVEFLLRLLSCNSFRRFATSPMNWVDLAAILPFYIELMVEGPGSSGASQSRVVRMLRLLRVMRLFRASSRLRNLQVVVDSLVASLDVIAMLLVLLLVLLVVSATIIYYVEGALIKDTWFDSIPLTMYYMHVTLTTTGYGDYYPQSSWGRFVAGVFMLLCMVTLSLPIGVVGGNFSSLWERYTTVRDSVERSRRAWRVRSRLRGLAARQCSAMDNIIAAMNRLKNALEDGCADDPSELEGVAVLRERLAELHRQMQEVAPEAKGAKGDAASAAGLRAAVVSLRKQLANADGRFSDLHTLLTTSSRLTSPDLRDQLDKMAVVHKEMAAWAGAGAAAAGQSRGLLSELRALQQAVTAEEEWCARQREEQERQLRGAKGSADGVGGEVAKQ